MIVQLAWRNVWRNPRRTAVILAAVVIACWSMIVSMGLMHGLAEQVVRNGVAALTGHLQVHGRGYRDDPTVEHRIDDPAAVAAAASGLLPPGSRVATRVRVGAVASNARHAAGVTLVGIDAAEERGVSFVPESLTEGSLPDAADPTGIVVGRALLDRFETRLGHRLILMSRTAAGDSASRAFRIVGVFRTERAAAEERLVFVGRAAAQDMLGLGRAVSEISIVLPDRGAVEATAAKLRDALPAAVYEVHTWAQLLPLVRASVAMYDAMGRLWTLVAFVAMGFGIVNTILMTVLERTRELGVLRALGMRPGSVVREVLTEALLLLLLGAVAGNALGLLTVAALAHHGLDLSALATGAQALGMPRTIYPAVTAADVLAANALVLVLGVLVSGYPAALAARITPVKAMART